jgi:recombination protein RecA
MASHPGSLLPLPPAHPAGRELPARSPHFELDALAGRLCELSGGPLLSLVMPLLHAAQRRGQPTAWISATRSLFYPPDVAAWGIDLSALAIVRVADAVQAARALDHLLRCGAFGLLVVDLGERAQWPMPMQSRLVGLLHRHRTALICLTQGRSQLGALVSLRAVAQLRRQHDGLFRCELRALKDKRHGVLWQHVEVCCGPEGLV